LETSVLDRLCGPLCDQVLGTTGGQARLEALEAANLFIVPLDNERRWYRYHHLFAELLRHRLEARGGQNEARRRASLWYAQQGLLLESFQQAVRSQDLDLSCRVVAGDGMPLYFRGILAPISDWVNTLPPGVRALRPELELHRAWALLLSARHGQLEAPLLAAERDLPAEGAGSASDDLWGQLFTLRAFVAIAHRDAGVILPLARRALALLAPDNGAVRSAAQCAVGVGFQYQGDRESAKRTYDELLLSSRSSGNRVFTVAGSIALGNLLLSENQLHRASELFEFVLQTVNDPANTLNCEAYLGLARIRYEWNDRAQAEDHLRHAITLSGQIDCDTGLAAEALRARLLLSRNDPHVEGVLQQALDVATRKGFAHRASELAQGLVVSYLRTGKLAAASRLVAQHPSVVSQARLLLAQRDPVEAVDVLERWSADHRTAQPDELLAVLIVLALALRASGSEDEARSVIVGALERAESGGILRSFADEGQPLASLLRSPSVRSSSPAFVDAILEGLGSSDPLPGGLTEALSEREREILDLMARGLSNQQVGETLFLSLSTVKWHNQNLFGKLQVQRRTEAVARARDLGLLN
jgi:LuxR family maltose regulon positive regulatory protein